MTPHTSKIGGIVQPRRPVVDSCSSYFPFSGPMRPLSGTAHASRLLIRRIRLHQDKSVPTLHSSHFPLHPTLVALHQESSRRCCLPELLVFPGPYLTKAKLWRPSSPRFPFPFLALDSCGINLRDGDPFAAIINEFPEGT